MKILIGCNECLIAEISRTGKDGTVKSPPQHLVEVKDDGFYVLECSHGHTSQTRLQNQHFEILFEMGAHAILDGYYREAVSAFSASLERFYEFATKAFCLRARVQQTQFATAWKEVKSSSERQYGAHHFLYTVNTGKPPRVLSSDGRKFRNDVIHNGHIPTRAKTIAFGALVRGLLEDELSVLRRDFDGELSEITSQHLWAMPPPVPGSIPVTTLVGTIVCASTASGSGSFEERLDALELARKAWQEAAKG